MAFGFLYYQYIPCPGSTGTTFTSNVNLLDDLQGSTITFPDLFPGQCFSVYGVGSLIEVKTDVTIDWTVENYSTFGNCDECLEFTFPFPCLCSTVTNTNDFPQAYKYIDCTGEDDGTIILQPGEKSIKICLREWIDTNGFFEFYGDCVNDECPSMYLLTDCSDSNNTLCTNTDLSFYANTNAVILINNYPNICWSIEAIEECTAPVITTVVQNFINCQECLSNFVTNYQLVNCINGVIIYTSTNLSEYVDQVVKLEAYGNDCWFVRAVNSQIPSDITVTVSESFNTCPECTSNYFLLEDCNLANNTTPIVTITDLSQYVGQVITLSTCPEICWTVSEGSYSPDYQVVNIESDFEDCEECILNQPSYCISFFNPTEIGLSVDYIDSFGNSNKLNVAPQERTEKTCYILWAPAEGLIVTNLGLCVNGECVEPVRPKRKVTPGYDTPVCSTEYYEKVVCNFSEWMYKDVLQKRYGISNCCPEELLKWQIKYEMLMLDILVNPDYECTTTTSCCGPTISLNHSRDCNS